jgi:hypothetical protein
VTLTFVPDGRDGVGIPVVERGRRRRFVLPTDDVASTEASIRRRAATALLVQAAHVIHF